MHFAIKVAAKNTASANEKDINSCNLNNYMHTWICSMVYLYQE